MGLAADTWCGESANAFPADENGAVGLRVAAGEGEVVGWRHCLCAIIMVVPDDGIAFVFACLVGRFGLSLPALGCLESLYLCSEHEGQSLRTLTMSDNNAGTMLLALRLS